MYIYTVKHIHWLRMLLGMCVCETTEIRFCIRRWLNSIACNGLLFNLTYE